MKCCYSGTVISCYMESESVTLVAKGFVKLIFLTDWQKQIKEGRRSVAHRRVLSQAYWVHLIILKFYFHSWFHLYGASQAAKSTEQAKITNFNVQYVIDVHLYLYAKLNWDAYRILPAENSIWFVWQLATSSGTKGPRSYLCTQVPCLAVKKMESQHCNWK